MASLAPPPPPPPPPKPASKSQGERARFNQFISSHKALQQYAGQIWTWANNYGGVTPTQLAATLWFESGGNPNATSKVGASGLAQIYDSQANPTNAAGVPFFRANRQISQQDKTNPAFAIQYAAWRLSGAVQKYGSIDAAYLKNYNPGYTGSTNPISRLLPKGYVGTPSQTSTQTATKTIATQTVTSAMKDPWVVQTAHGFKYVNATEPPKGTVTYGGQPVTQSGFTQVWKQTYADTFFAYTGRQAKPQEIVQILKNAPSVYTLGNNLATQKSFSNSPVYKKSAPGLVSYAKTILGNNWKPSGGIIRKAIAQNWDQATFYAHIKSLPAYQQGPEFKDNLAKMQSTFESVYGKNSDPEINAMLKQKALAGWTTDEFQSWLIAQPAYKHTAAYQAKATQFLTQMGLITGAQATLSGDQVDQLLAAPQFGKTAPAPAQAPARGPLAPPNLVSENGQGGGNGPQIAAPKAPVLVSEHGRGGGYA